MANRLKMAMVQTILRLLEQGWSQRRIARELENDRATAARLVLDSKPAKATPGSAEAPIDSKPAKAPPGSAEGNSQEKPAKNLRRKEPTGQEE